MMRTGATNTIALSTIDVTSSHGTGSITSTEKPAAPPVLSRNRPITPRNANGTPACAHSGNRYHGTNTTAAINATVSPAAVYRVAWSVTGVVGNANMIA